MADHQTPGSRCPVAQWDYFSGKQPPMTAYRAMDSLGEEYDFFRVDDPRNSYYVFTRYEAIREGLQRYDLFSSSVSVVVDPDPPYKWIPLMVDPPEHQKWRRLLASYFSPRRVERLTPRMREVCGALIGGFAGDGHCDALGQFTQRFPSTVFLDILGLSEEDLPMFLGWEHRILHSDSFDDAARFDTYQAMQEVTGFFGELLDHRRTRPARTADDIVTNALDWKIDGQPCSRDDLLNCLLLLFMAGLDTVSSQLGWSFLHLATHGDDRRRVAREPAIHPQAVEEFLRAFPMVLTGRKVLRDNVFHGLELKAGETVMFPQPAAGRDTTHFADARTVDLDRGEAGHISFSAGVHRCLGSNLARAEMVVAMGEWHRRIPEYQLDPGEPITEHAGGVWGLDRLPLRWSR